MIGNALEKNAKRFIKGPVEIRQGFWQTALADIAQCDAVIADPPYGRRTHRGQRHRRKAESSELWANVAGHGYQAFTADDVGLFVTSWAERCNGWFLAFTSHDLFATYESKLQNQGRYTFAPLACVQKGQNVRLAGDGPSNWTTWLVVARPRKAPFVKWGARPGAYVGTPKEKFRGVVGAKPLWLMRELIRDYTSPGDLIVDPFAGSATTLLAAAMEDRRAIGCELNPDTFDRAVDRIATEISASAPFGPAVAQP